MRGLSVWGMAFGLFATKLGAQSPAPKRQPADSQTIVFVCEHGTAKSVLAMVHFTRLAHERGLAVRAVSRGTAPDPALPAFMVAGLRTDGFDVGSFSPSRFGERDVLSATLIVSFDQPDVASVVRGRVPVVRWDQLPSVTANYPVARAAIARRVEALVDSLTGARPPR
jgi:arsenate reductase